MSSAIEKLLKVVPTKIISFSHELASELHVKPEKIEAIVADVSRHYGYLIIPKANGDKREIRPPKPELRAIQRRLLELIYLHFRFPEHMHGGVPNCSVFTYARPHVGHEMVCTLDIRKFFPTTTRERTAPVFAAMGLRGSALEYACALTCFEGALPQGAPTSPALANLSFNPLDVRIRKLCQRRRLVFGRYMDDIAISGDQAFQALKGPLSEIIMSGGYSLAEEKVHFYARHERQVICGLVVNDRLRPTTEFVRELKTEIRAAIECGAQAVADVQGLTKAKLRERLRGKIGHIRQSDDVLAAKLMHSFDRIRWHTKTTFCKSPIAAEFAVADEGFG